MKIKKEVCSHCSLKFEKSHLIEENINNETLFFCCKGCQGVYHLLYNKGVGDFYEKKGTNTLNKPLALNDDSSTFNISSFKDIYITQTNEGFCKINLIIQGIHCNACIWLNEKILNDEKGILEASINFTNNKAVIIWDEDILKISEIIDKIRSIGYDAIPYVFGINEKKNVNNKRDYFSKLSVAIFSTINIMMIDIAKYFGYLSSINNDILSLIHIGEFIFASPVLFYSGWIFFKGAYYGLKNKIVNMDFLISFGSILTYIYSVYVLLTNNGDSYFDSVVMIITFVLVGKYLELVSKNNANDTLNSIKSELPYESTIIKDNKKIACKIEQIQINDIIEVKNGQQASVDGILLDSYASFNQSSISGESKDILKKRNDSIYGGTINTGDVIRYKANKIYKDSTLSNILLALENSVNSKLKIQDFTNKLSKQFSLSILFLCVLSFISWYYYSGDFETSLIIAISVVVISCPCALALATPIASLVGISWLSQKGLLFKEAKTIEVFTRLDTIVFDKTGTITNGMLSVEHSNEDKLNQSNINILYSLVSSSTHLVSVALSNYLENKYKDLKLVELENVLQIESIGINAKYENKVIFGGKSKKQSLYTNFDFIINDEVIASFELKDSIKKDAMQSMQYLKENNIDIIICSGDNNNVVKEVANDLNIKQYKSNMSPLQKAELVENLRKENKIVAFVGDGVNDVLSLSKADISISMASGSDFSLDISDVVVLNNSLESIVNSIYISKRTYMFIKQNLFISLLYNVITIPIAMAGYVVPFVAAISMSLSSLLVVGNSMRIKNTKIK